MSALSHLMVKDLPAAQALWQGFPKYNFVGGHNDASHTPVDLLADTLIQKLKIEGRDLATYNLTSGPQGYLPLRELIAANLKARAQLNCDPSQILVTSGSLQALDLVNALLLEKGDTVLIEEACYSGTISRFQRLGVNFLGVDVDEEGMRMDKLRGALADLAKAGIRPKFIYTVPTVQNPTGTVMPLERRLEMLALAKEYDTAIFEDDCYADLLWEGERPSAIRARDDEGRVIYCGSFSKSVAPALRVGYLVADWEVISRILPLKTDAGSGALEQMALASWTTQSFAEHVTALRGALKAKCQAMMEAVAREFGTSAEFSAPKGGIFLWVTLPQEVDTGKLAAAAAAHGVAVNPGGEWSADHDANRHKMRICFAHPSIEEINEGISKLAEVCHDQFGVPVRSGNVAR